MCWYLVAANEVCNVRCGQCEILFNILRRQNLQLLVGDWVAKAYKPVLDAKITYTMQLVLAYGMI
jgi:hypothetical protein